MGRLEDLYKTKEELRKEQEAHDIKLQEEITSEEIHTILSTSRSNPGYVDAVLSILERIKTQGIQNEQQRLFVKEMTIHTIQKIRNQASHYLRMRSSKPINPGKVRISNYRNNPDAKKRVSGSPRH